MAVLWRERDADTGASVELMAKNLVRLADVFQDASRKLLCEIFAATTHLQDCKLITAEAAYEIARPQTCC